eukprot:scaffold232653_cov22-Tisochrysis_lutea.AAC.1
MRLPAPMFACRCMLSCGHASPNECVTPEGCMLLYEHECVIYPGSCKTAAGRCADDQACWQTRMLHASMQPLCPPIFELVLSPGQYPLLSTGVFSQPNYDPPIQTIWAIICLRTQLCFPPSQPNCVLTPSITHKQDMAAVPSHGLSPSSGGLCASGSAGSCGYVDAGGEGLLSLGSAGSCAFADAGGERPISLSSAGRCGFIVPGGDHKFELVDEQLWRDPCFP